MSKKNDGFFSRTLRALFGEKEPKPTATPSETAPPAGAPMPPSAGKAPAATSSTAAGTDSKSAAERDRAVRVFVSSTFLDMIEDRNELMSQVYGR